MLVGISQYMPGPGSRARLVDAQEKNTRATPHEDSLGVFAVAKPALDSAPSRSVTFEAIKMGRRVNFRLRTSAARVAHWFGKVAGRRRPCVSRVRSSQGRGIKGSASDGPKDALTNEASRAFSRPPQTGLLHRRFIAAPDPKRAETGLPHCSLAKAAILRRVTGNGRPIDAPWCFLLSETGAPWTHHACRRFFRGPDLAAPCGERGGFHPEDNLRRVVRESEHLHPGQVGDCLAPIEPRPFPGYAPFGSQEDAECVPGRIARDNAHCPVKQFTVKFLMIGSRLEAVRNAPEQNQASRYLHRQAMPRRAQLVNRPEVGSRPTKPGLEPSGTRSIDCDPKMTRKSPGKSKGESEGELFQHCGDSAEIGSI